MIFLRENYEQLEISFINKIKVFLRFEHSKTIKYQKFNINNS